MDVVGVQVQPPPLLEATVQRHLTPNHPAYVRVVDFRLARVTAEAMATSIFGRIQAGVVYTPDKYVDITVADGEGLIWLFDEHHDDQPEIFSYPKRPRFSNSKTAIRRGRVSVNVAHEAHSTDYVKNLLLINAPSFV